MKPALDVASLVLGIAILYWGAEWLIRGSAGLARAVGVTPLVVGLTVVAYGTAAPELAVATKTALAGHTPIALGTVIGSCAANIALALGLVALIAPPTIDGRIIRRELPVLVGSAIAVPILFRNGVLSQFEGIFLVGCAVVFTIAQLTVAARLDVDLDLAERTHADQAESDDAAASSSAFRAGAAAGGKARPKSSRVLSLVMMVFGLALLVLGATLLVGGGRGIAQQLGMSERMLGLTIIALGTALPELIRAVVAAARGEAALAVSTVIGSNLLSVFLVLGVTACIKPIRLGERMHLVDLVGLVAITLLGVLVMRGSRRITRFEGALLVLAYIAFLVCAAIF
ncbi:MAG TPA: calcium/sodium antiporter [Kofleriaceae bacterium]